jgi:hypothetical protein
MAHAQLNPQVLGAIKDLTRSDAIMRKFLTKMLMEEHQHPGQWWFKEEYKTQIREDSRDWGGEQ